MSARQNYNELLAKHSAFVAAARAEEAKGNITEAKAQLAKATELEDRLDTLKEIMDSEEKYFRDHAASFGTDAKDMAEMGKALIAGESVRFDKKALMQSGLFRKDSVTLATGTLVTPTGGGTNIHDPLGGISTLIDQVTSVHLDGMGAYYEPYVVSEMDAKTGKVETLAGTAREATDPIFAKAKIAPYEANVTALVDRNLRRLSPADYAAKIQSMALRALRKKANYLIVNGDGQANPDMFGIINAKNSAGGNIFATKDLGAKIDVDTVRSLVFSYGGDEDLGGNARLLLTKPNLEAIGKLRGANEKKPVFEIEASGGNPNTGVVKDGGLIVPYTINSSVGDGRILYGDPINYLLALFGDYSIRVDSSVKALERMEAILGDVFLGGNLVVDKGFVVGTINAAG